jgi:hypothetical protein
MADLSDDIRSLIQAGIDPVTFEEISHRRRGPHPWRRRTAARVVSIAVVMAVAVPVILVVSSTHAATTAKHGALHKNNRVAQRRVISALDTTIASGSFNISFSQQAPTAPTAATTTTTAPTCGSGTGSGNFGGLETPTTIVGDSPGTTAVSGPAVVCGSVGTNAGLAISGQGTIDTNPFAMVVETEVPGLGEITLRDNGTDVWELGGGDYGLSPDSTDSGPGSSLPGFAGLVEGTLGARQGASAMMVLANPTGYLELDEDAISSADQIGTDTVDGVPVTVYQVTLDPDQEATVTGANAYETEAIQSALSTLQQEGYTGTSVKISVDSGGYIRQTVATASFADGSSQTSETTFSDFGCAGTVLMPGQAGSSSPPTGCVSPDTSTTTTTAPPA